MEGAGKAVVTNIQRPLGTNPPPPLASGPGIQRAECYWVSSTTQNPGALGFRMHYGRPLLWLKSHSSAKGQSTFTKLSGSQLVTQHSMQPAPTILGAENKVLVCAGHVIGGGEGKTEIVGHV